MASLPEPGPLSDAELKVRRERIRRGLRWANTAALLVLLIVVGLALAAVFKGFQAERAQGRADDAIRQEHLTQVSALLEQARAHRRRGRAGQRLDSLDAVSRAVAIEPSAELRQEAIAALACSDVRFVPVWTNSRRSFVVEFRPGMQQFAAGAAGGAIRLLRTKDAHEDAVLPATGHEVGMLQFSPDGRFLAANYYGGTNRIWEISSQRVVLELTPGDDFCDFTPDSRQALVTSGAGRGRCVDLADGAEKWHQDLGPGSWVLRVQPQGQLFAAFAHETSTAQVRSLETGESLGEITHASRLGGLAWNPDGQTMVLGRENGWLYAWDVKSWRQVDSWRGHDDLVAELRFDPTGRWLATSSWDNTIRFWRCPGYRFEVAAYGFVAHFPGEFSADGHELGCERYGEVLGLLDLSVSPVLRRLYVPPSDARGAWSLDVSPDGKCVAAGYENGVVLLDFVTGQQFDSQPVFDCRSVLFTADGAGLVTSGAAGLTYWPIERTAAGSPRLGKARTIREGIRFVYAALSTDGHWAAAANRSQQAVEMYNLANPAERFALTNHFRVQFVALSPDGRWVAGGTWNGRGVKVWELRSGKAVRELPVEGSATVVFSPDSRLLITGGRRCQAWETASWSEVYRRPDTDLPVLPAAFSPDGRIVAVMKDTDMVELLEAASGHVLAELEAPGSVPLSWLRFTPDGASLLVMEWTRSIRVWDLSALHRELGRLGLDWETGPAPGTAPGATAVAAGSTERADPPVQGATAKRRPLLGRSFWLSPGPGSAFYLLALGGVVLGVLVGIHTVRYNYRMLRQYQGIEGLAADREQQLQSARVELVHSQKMRALGTLATGIAHDFNNLLSIIRMSNKLIDRRARGDVSVRHHVANVEQAVLQGKSLVGSMLGYARNEDGGAGPSDVKAVVENAVSLLSKEFLSGLALTLELERETPRVCVTRGRLEQVLLNLLVNASEAMQGQGKLRILSRTRAPAPELPWVLRPRMAERFVELKVIDSGPGIAPEVGERIFEPFFTTKQGRSEPGTGLGLSLVYAIAREDQLGLGFESTPGQGTAFTLVMPAAAP
jgi:signal transduction histidine kinase